MISFHRFTFERGVLVGPVFVGVGSNFWWRPRHSTATHKIISWLWFVVRYPKWNAGLHE